MPHAKRSSSGTPLSMRANHYREYEELVCTSCAEQLQSKRPFNQHVVDGALFMFSHALQCVVRQEGDDSQRTRHGPGQLMVLGGVLTR
jgi:hypothetical protein